MTTSLFGVITGPDFAAAEKLLAVHKPYIDGIELRLDYFGPIDQKALASFLQNCKLPVMLTVRRKDQGGYFPGTEEERLALIESLCSLHPAYVDLEYDVPSDYRKRLFESYPHICFLSSYHDFSGSPVDFGELYAKVQTPYAQIHKIAVTASSSLDALRLLAFVKMHALEKKIVGIAMGEEGRITRILAPVVGSCLTYATLSEEGITAPGQLNARELQETYHFRGLNPQTEVYCLIGDPIEASLGAAIHNAVFANASLNAVYVKARVKKEEIPSFFSLARQLPFKGFSVTMPLKEEVMPLLTQVSQQTEAIGACNTIKIQEGQMLGYNTDGIGALNAIERRGLVSRKHVVIIGAGGSAKALAYEASQRGALVTIINRTPLKAIEIANSLGCTGGGWELFPKVCESGYDVMINCIPDSTLIDEKWILPGIVAMDIVYIPKNTPFLVKALSKKCHLIFGYEMFVAQALEQELLWFSSQIDTAKAYAILEEMVVSNLN